MLLLTQLPPGQRSCSSPRPRRSGCGLLLLALCFSLGLARAAAEHPPVTLRETERTFFLDNGLLQIRIDKATGHLFSLAYHDLELLAPSSAGGDRSAGWFNSGPAWGGRQKSATVRAHPRDNGGERVEISCQFRNAPGAPDSPLDVDVRYSLARGQTRLHTYAILSHQPGYPALDIEEASFTAKLDPDVFDFLAVDTERKRLMPAPEDWARGERLKIAEARRLTTGIHKGQVEYPFDYAAVLSELSAYGWASSTDKVAVWFLNSAAEYLAGGPTKVDLTGSLDEQPGHGPLLRHVWLGRHYGGTSLVVAENESWTKVVGPFAIYCNHGATPDAMWQDALIQARTEAASWPYAWVSDPQYPSEAQRGTVSGQILIQDPLEPNLTVSNLWVGLTAPDYFLPEISTNEPGRDWPGGRLRGGFPAEVDWQRDGKFYQHWIPANPAGKFTIPFVRPGQYTLRAFADGVLGELAVKNVAVTPGDWKQLGTFPWSPRRYGRTLWQIGVPDRTAREFRHGDRFRDWELYFRYPREFPKDVNYIVGHSDWRQDWNYVQPPRINPDNVGAYQEPGRKGDLLTELLRTSSLELQPSTWSIKFGLNQTPRGRATLRLAFCGAQAGSHVEAFVNDQSIGDTGPLPPTSTMIRHGIRGFWVERTLQFPGDLLLPGANVIKLKAHATSWTQGVMYDVVRLELEEQ